MAPPEPPSPMTSATFGAPSARQASVERAMASAWPRSSASMPGIGAGRVDEADSTGRPKRSASSIRRAAFR